MVPMQQVRDLAKSGRAAMVVGTKAYDFTDFLASHPGGPEYLARNAGKVATQEFELSHPIDVIERTLTRAQFKAMVLGEVDASTIEAGDVASSGSGGGGAGAHPAPPAPGGAKPALEACINVYDFEAIATGTLTEQALAYYSSGGDDEITLRENHSAFHRLWLKPRVMVNVKHIDMRTAIQGHACAFPVFLSAVAMCKMGYPEGPCPGEMAWNRAAGEEGVPYMIPTLSGCSFEDIVSARVSPSQPMFFQLYVNQDRDKTRATVQKAEAAGCSVLFITCDAPQLGNREKDRRVKVTHAGAAIQSGVVTTKSEGTAKALTTFIDPSLSWEDLPFFRSITKMKIVLKGVGTAEDAVRALEAGCNGVLLSNHGGRQLDFARSGLEVLPEAMAALRAHKDYSPERFEVYVDGGVRRGTDIFKALALGATAVGLGRPALYAMAAYGAPGVAKMLQILKAELEMTMRLMGTPTLKDIRAGSVITDNLKSHISMVPADSLQQSTYIPAVTQAQRNKFGASAAGAGEAAHAPAPAAAAAAAAASAAAAPSTPSSALQLLTEVGGGLLSGFLVTTARLLVHRTSLLLLFYCLVHAGGNLLLLGGRPVYNGYADILRHHWLVSPCVTAFEVYLCAATAAHAASGAWLTWRGGKWGALYTARLILTGAAITAFGAVHLQHFRFSPAAHADLYREVLRVMGDPGVAGGYLAACLALGAHAYWGWENAARKFKDTASSTGKPAMGEGAKALGSGLIVAMTAAFCAATAYAYLKGRRA